MAIDMGGLEMKVRDAGGDELLAKLGLIDSTAEKVGAKPVTVAVSAPGAAGTAAAITDIGAKAEQASAKATHSLETVVAALRALDIQAKATPQGLIVVDPSNLESATSIVRRLGSEAQVTTAELAKMAVAARQAPATVTGTLPGLGLSAVAPQATAEAQRLAAAVAGIGTAAAQSTAATTGLGASIARATAPASGMNAIIERIIQNVVVMGTEVDVANRKAVASFTASADAAASYAIKLGATDAQLDRIGASIAAVEQRSLAGAAASDRVGGAFIQTGARAGAMTPKMRSAANGIAAVAFAATSATGSLQSMTLGAGLAASSLAAMASGPLALWAAGIGAAVVVVGTLIGAIQRLRADAAKPSAFALQQIADIKRLDVAEQVYQQRRLERERLEAEVAKRDERINIPLGRGGGAAASRTAALKAELERARAIENEVFERLQDMRGDFAKADAAATIDITVEGLQARNAAQEAADNARLAQEAAAYALGQRNLEQFHDERLKAIERQRQREVSALATREGLLRQVVPGEDPKGADARKRVAEADRIASEIAVVNRRAGQQVTDEIEARRAKREQLNRQIIQFEQREQEAFGDASLARIAMAEQESIAIARALVQSGVAPDDAERRRQAQLAFETQKIQFEQLENEATRIFDTIAVARARIEGEVLRGIISELEGQKQIAEAERDQVKALDDVLVRMAALALALKNPALANAFAKLRQDVQDLGNFVSPLEQEVRSGLDSLERLFVLRGEEIAKAFRAELARSGGVVTVGFAFRVASVTAAAEQLEQELKGAALNIANSFGNALSEGFASSMTKGSGKNFFEAFGNALLAGVGGIMVQMGSAMLAYGLIMALHAPLLAGTPFAKWTLSAPAAIAGGTALIALGAGLGAIASNNTGTRTGRGGSTFSAPNRDTVQHIWLDPDRNLERRQREVTTAVVRSGDPDATPMRPITVNVGPIFGPNDPVAQRELVATVNNGIRAGYRIG